MCKSLGAIAAALVSLSLGLFVADHAQAGGATSAPSKYNYQLVGQYQAGNHRSVQTADFPITEFSSSSAKNPVPKR